MLGLHFGVATRFESFVATTDIAQLIFWSVMAAAAFAIAVINALVWRRCQRRQRTEGYQCRITRWRHQYPIYAGFGWVVICLVRIKTGQFN